MIELYKKKFEDDNWIRTSDPRLIRKWLSGSELLKIFDGEVIKKNGFMYSPAVTMDGRR
jgi:hypothetical protein